MMRDVKNLFTKRTAKTLDHKLEQNIPRKETAASVIISTFIHISVSDLYIPLIGLSILLQENSGTDRGSFPPCYSRILPPHLEQKWFETCLSCKHCMRKPQV
jgi:hypothetical protein